MAWDACGAAFTAVLALLKAAEPNPASTAALVRFLTTSISGCGVLMASGTVVNACTVSLAQKQRATPEQQRNLTCWHYSSLC